MTDVRLRAEGIAEAFDLPLRGVGGVEITSPDAMDEASAGSVTWLKKLDDENEAALRGLSAALVVVPQPNTEQERVFVEDLAKRCAVIEADNPRLLFARILRRFYEHMTVQIPAGVDPRAVVHETARIGADVTISAQCYVGPDVQIGDGTVIHPGVIVHSGTIIGSNCIIDSNAVIGTRGFGYVRDDDGSLVHFPQVGHVVIEDDVEIQSGTTVVRPGLGTTRIGQGTKIDCLCHIGHNAQIGPHCVLTACCEIGAGVVVEEGSWIGPNSCSIENIRFGRGCLVGIGSTVVRSVEPESVVAGSPAEPIETVKRARRAIKRLIMDSE